MYAGIGTLVTARTILAEGIDFGEEKVTIRGTE